MWAERRIVDC